jgi:hypothetical protein
MTAGDGKARICHPAATFGSGVPGCHTVKYGLGPDAELLAVAKAGTASDSASAAAVASKIRLQSALKWTVLML